MGGTVRGKLWIWWVFAGILLFAGCGSSKYILMKNLHAEQTVKILFKDGNSVTGLVKSKKGNTVTYVSEVDHKEHAIPITDIHRIEKTDKYLDNQAYPISGAEIEKNRSSRNTWGYAIGGAVIGGAAGIVVGLPFWYADVKGIPPYFVGGAGAVAGSIYFGYLGQNKDKEAAIDKIRFIRDRDREMEKEVEKEKQEIKKLEEEKEQLKEQLKKQKPE